MRPTAGLELFGKFQANYWVRKISLVTVCTYSSVLSFAQSAEDSVLLANSEKSAVQQHKGLFGLSKPEFGPFVTLEVMRFDSAVVRKRTRDGTAIEAQISSDGSDIDHTKFVTVAKTKFYRLKLATNAEPVETIFSISSVSKEKKQTFLGKLLSKNDEGKDMVLSYDRDVAGTIRSGDLLWEFGIEKFTSGGRQTATSYNSTASIAGGYLTNKDDSLNIVNYSSFTADLLLINKHGEHVGALQFRQKPFNAWIRNDLRASQRNAIAAMFAVIFAVKDF